MGLTQIVIWYDLTQIVIWAGELSGREQRTKKLRVESTGGARRGSKEQIRILRTEN